MKNKPVWGPPRPNTNPKPFQPKNHKKTAPSIISWTSTNSSENSHSKAQSFANGSRR